jgi:erythromycin esterase
LRKNPEAKIVLWAHNGHVARNAWSMGYELAAAYGKEYLPIGFATGKGNYRAIKQGEGLVTNALQEPPAGSWEARLANVGKALLFVDLRSAPPELREPIPMRSIGALAMDQQFHPHEAPAFFDLLIYIEETSPAVELRR